MARWIDAIEQFTELGDGWQADWLLIAMSHWRLDRRDEAVRWYAKSLAWATGAATIK